MARSSSIGTASGLSFKEHSLMGTKLLMPRMAAFVSSTNSRLQASTLFRSSLSAKPTCCADSFTAPSDRSFVSCWMKCLQSTTVRMPSILQYFRTTSSIPKVFTMGPGSAMPVVSIKIPSSMAPSMPLAHLSSTAAQMFLMAITRSSRTLQQRQPLSSTVMDSVVAFLPTPWSISKLSMGTSPNSFSMTAYLLPCCASRM
mmetsp:Transcript_158822/g.296045  ORF Transcript_158822/g.296045 Transcript_158822/m.296045 type:complete len:200 (-) Transcript_158822:71-670(-)